MPKAWKIAPGGHADVWPQCREGGCILIGWREVGDYTQYEDVDAIRKALRRANGGYVRGAGPGAALSVWRFANRVNPKDVVVANDGRGKVVGIGVIDSQYLPPGSRKIPIHHEWLPNARLVKWHVTVGVQLRKYFFPQDTVWPLEPWQCDEIIRAYGQQHRGLKGIVTDLFHGVEPHVDLEELTTREDFAGYSDIEGLRSEYRVTRAKRSRWLRDKTFAQANGICAVCERDFKKYLAGNGQRVLQVHHCKQLSARHAPSVTKQGDLVVVCANCHLLLHLDVQKAMTVDQLRNLLKNDGYLVT